MPDPDETQTPDSPFEIEGFAVERAPEDIASPPVDSNPPPPAPPENQAPPPPPPAPTQPPSDPELPAWLREIPEAERVGVAERYLSNLSEEQRLQLPSLMRYVNSAAEQAYQRGQQDVQSTALDEARERELYESAGSLLQDLQSNNIDPTELPDRLSIYAEAAADTRQAELNDEIQNSVFAMAQLIGAKQIPGDVVARASNADGWGSALQEYQRWGMGEAFNLGIAEGKKQAGSAQQADAAADRERIRAEYLAELQAGGRLRDDVPPVLDGVQTPAGGFNAETYKQMLERGEQPSPEQIDALGRQYASMV